MNKESFLRIQLIIQDSNSKTFETNLAKMIAVVLFEASDVLTVGDIKNELLNSFELEFTEEEIERAIEKKHSGIEKEEITKNVVKYGERYETNQIFYRLSPEIEDKFKKKIEKNFEEDVIGQFLKENKDVVFDVSEFKDILHNFLYGVFNSNKETLLLFLNEKTINDKSEDIVVFNETQRRAINTFLNWNNPNKDHLIFQTVSYCVEYCLLNVKKGFSSYQNIFKGKKFYLDTNVILRLAGINNEERKTVIASFIKKCRENGIQLLYTNYTYQEIQDTIHRNVLEVEKIMHGKRMVSKKYWRYYSKPSTNLDFIELYDNWCREPGSNYADYSMFEKSIMRTINNILKEFKKEDYLGFSEKKDSDYNILFENLRDYKKEQGANHYEKSVSIDVNNYMYVRNLRNKNGVTISDIKEYLISTDGNLCNWSKDIIPGAIPIVVLPSVWYSLILKFKGRANDDYKAFNLFLNLRFKNQDTKLDLQKDTILHMVQNLDEPTDIKELILENIAEKINDKKMEDVNPEKVINEAKDSVIRNEADKLFEKYKGAARKEIDKQAETRTLHSLAEAKANKKIGAINKINVVLNVLGIVVGTALIITIVLAVINVINMSKIMKLSLFGYTIEGWTGLLSWIVPLILCLLISPAKRKAQKYFSYEEIKNRELERLQKEIIKAV